MATYVLIPGAGGAAWFWHPVHRRLEAAGHEVIAVDLPAADDTAGLSAYCDTVVAAIGQRAGVILAAHSFGGFTAPLVCERVPVALMVLVNAMTPKPGESAADWWENSGLSPDRRTQAEREGWDPDDEQGTFFHDISAELTAESAEHDPPQSGTPFQQPWPLETWPDVPTRFILSRHDRCFPSDFQRRIVAERLGITPDEIDGGHLSALSQPEQMTALLEAYRVEFGIR